MPSSVFYVQSCPACGRNLQVRVKYLGKPVACQHCNAEFVAQEENGTLAASESGLALMDRADELLRAVEQHKAKQSAQASANHVG